MSWKSFWLVVTLVLFGGCVYDRSLAERMARGLRPTQRPVPMEVEE